MISAKIIADSKNLQGDRLTTFVLVFPRIVLAEFNTHRMLSRNSASSRAIPFEKMLKLVKENPFIPIKWMKEHKGMQGSEYFNLNEIFVSPNGLENPNQYTNNQVLETAWLLARDKAVETAIYLSDVGLTKQIVNRLLEPFMWHTVIVTASEWENFFALRAHPAAEIHIADLAQKMLDVYNESEPKLLEVGEWHVPFGDNIDYTKLQLEVLDNWNKRGDSLSTLANDAETEAKIKIATARCARVSYLNFEGKDDYAADIKLFDMLSTSGHWSPFEHCARAMSDEEYYEDDRGICMSDKNIGWSGNLRGFVQYRKMFEDENKNDDRVKQK